MESSFYHQNDSRLQLHCSWENFYENEHQTKMTNVPSLDPADKMPAINGKTGLQTGAPTNGNGILPYQTEKWYLIHLSLP